MTVDSAYYVIRYTEPGMTVFPFKTESIGNTAMRFVLILDEDGTRLLLNEMMYTVEYDMARDPIFKYGRVTLKEPLMEGYTLSIERYTPRQNDLVINDKRRFPSNQIENMLDKVTFMLQELEGHLCDCSGDYLIDNPDVPGGGVDPPPGEVCKTYECDAFGNFLNGGGSVVHLPYSQGGPTPSLGVNDVIIAEKGPGLLVYPNNDGFYTENVPEGVIGGIDNCTGFMWNIQWDGFGTATKHAAYDLDISVARLGFVVGALLKNTGLSTTINFLIEDLHPPYEVRNYIFYTRTDGLWSETPFFGGWRATISMTEDVYADAWEMQWDPHEDVATAAPGNIVAYRDGIEVGVFRQNSPVPIPGRIVGIEVAASTFGAIAHLHANGYAYTTEDWAAYRDALAQNKIGYVDPNPDCIPG